MRKAVLISIQPKWCELIARGKKTVEVRKTIPKLDTPFKCYIYCTKAPKGWFFMHAPDVRMDGKVIGEFVCDEIELFSVTTDDNSTISKKYMIAKSCMTIQQLAQYELSSIAKDFSVYKIGLYGWHISHLKIYDKPKELREFGRYDKPIICPQSRCGKCGHWKYMRVNADEYDYDCDCNGLLDNIVPLNRAPQSWCYVEEREDNG